MKVISTNIATPTKIIWKGKEEYTGIFKKSVTHIFLGYEGVKNDAVIDKKYHGGNNKACYLYSLDHYAFWKDKYPNILWSNGMFGENITIKGLKETGIYIGNIYKIGEAIIQISEPRLPCYKLGLRFNSQKIIKEFTNTTYCGSYTKVLQEGIVSPEDELVLQEKKSGILLSEVYSLFSSQKNNTTLLQKALDDPFLNENFKNNLKRKLK